MSLVLILFSPTIIHEQPPESATFEVFLVAWIMIYMIHNDDYSQYALCTAIDLAVCLKDRNVSFQ